MKTHQIVLPDHEAELSKSTCYVFYLRNMNCIFYNVISNLSKPLCSDHITFVYCKQKLP